MHVHGPGAALQLHLRQYDWIKRQEHNPYWLKWCRGLSMARGPSSLRAKAHFMWQDMTDALNTATTYYVGQTVQELMLSAAEVAEPEPLFPTDLPSPSGLMIFENPLPVLDHMRYDNGDSMLPINAFMWNTREVTVIDPDTQEVSNHLGITYTIYSDGVDGNAGDPTVPFYAQEHSAWAFGVSWDATGRIGTLNAHKQSPHLAQCRVWLLTILRLLWQEILVPDTFGADKVERKRFQRMMDRKWDDGGMKVLRLRKVHRDPVEREGAPDDNTWRMTTRSITRPHWRQQYYRSLGEVGDPNAYRRIWIFAFIRGPEGAPLIVKHNVTTIVR